VGRPSDDVVSDRELRQRLPFQNHGAQAVNRRIPASPGKLARVVYQDDMTWDGMLQEGFDLRDDRAVYFGAR
jgi:hypothetical protein